MLKITTKIFRQQIEINKELLMGIEEALYFLDKNDIDNARDSLLKSIDNIKNTEVTEDE